MFSKKINNLQHLPLFIHDNNKANSIYTSDNYSYKKIEKNKSPSSSSTSGFNHYVNKKMRGMLCSVDWLQLNHYVEKIV